VEAVLELASFHEMEEHHLELLDKLSESLGTFISNSKVNDRTRRLLQQAQTMSEELRANEEEMRQNLEELTATQEALSRKEREYQDRIAHLEEELSVVKS
jgi:predicted  nucleic acid-binding Zn-ribbon protein